MELVQLLGDAMLTWGLNVGAITPQPEPEATTTTFDWVPLFTAFLGATAGIGGVVVGQIIAARNEAKRLRLQHEREDNLRKLDELKSLFAELSRDVDALATHRRAVMNTQAELREIPVNDYAVPELDAKLEAQTRDYQICLTRAQSTIRLVEIHGADEVREVATNYVKRIEHKEKPSEKELAIRATRPLLTVAMRLTLENDEPALERLRDYLDDVRIPDDEWRFRRKQP